MTEPGMVPTGVGGPLLPLEGQQSAPRGPGESSRRDDRRSDYRSVRCSDCGAVVLAAKFSIQHTSVQWDAAAVSRCAEFGRRVAAGQQTPLIERCEAMRASIDAAAFDGRLPVAPP
jgi:hypothetical protein